MPAKTPMQYGAMRAAAHGRSTLGIPAAVGRKFVAKTPPKQRSVFSRALGVVRRKHGGY